MPEVFVTADLHFGHRRLVRNEEGFTPRPFFDVEEMDETMIERFNSLVGPKDKTYIVGDVSMPRRGIKQLSRLNGELILIKGNHDMFPLKDYTPYFRDIRGVHVMDDLVFTHIPVHPVSKQRYRGNVHGHLHEFYVMDEWTQQPDPYYFSTCVEQHNYYPVNYDEILEYFKDFKSPRSH